MPTEPTSDDLNLVADMADAGKTEDELWTEISAAETETAAPKDGGDRTDDFPDGDIPADTPDEPKPVEESVKPAEQTDIWAGASEEQKAAFDALKAERDRLDHSARSNSHRVSALQRRINDLSKLTEKPTDLGGRKPLAEELSALRSDYPELAEPLSKVVGTIESRLVEQEEGRRRAAETERLAAQTELTTLLSAEVKAVNDAFPNLGQFLKENAQAFKAWTADQPLRIRQAVDNNFHEITNAAEIIPVIAAFDAFLHPEPAPAPAPARNGAAPAPTPNPPLNDRRSRQLDATASPHRSGGRPTVSGIPENGDPEEIWKAFDAAERAEARA